MNKYHVKPELLVCWFCNQSPKDCKCPDEPEAYHFVLKEET